MPLTHSAPGTPGFSHNIEEMVKAGHPQKQAIAAAYRANGERSDDDNTTIQTEADELFCRLHKLLKESE